MILGKAWKRYTGSMIVDKSIDGKSVKESCMCECIQMACRDTGKTEKGKQERVNRESGEYTLRKMIPWQIGMHENETYKTLIVGKWIVDEW